MIDAVEAYLSGDLPELVTDIDAGQSVENEAIVEAKKTAAQEHLRLVRARWRGLLEHMDEPAERHATLLVAGEYEHIHPGDTLLAMLLRRDIRISWRAEVQTALREIFSGREWAPVIERLSAIHAETRSSRLFVATHMHAGDGNVHTNIPVNSNDYQMLHGAEHIVDRIMALARELGGVISGEHGIGLTKIQYLDDEVIAAFARYKQQIDPDQHFNRDKLQAGSGLGNAYTPSLRLLQQEAILLEASELGALNDDIRHCLRCGKCKPVCTTHVPRANLLYSPRNKILATGLIIEAFLYEEQTRRGISIRHFDEMNDVADHCTVCHKCLNPCPVNIDFGDVSIRMRGILRQRGQKRGSPATWLAMKFLNVTDPVIIKLMRKLMIEWGYKAQRLAYRLARRITPRKNDLLPKATTGAMPLKAQVVHFMKRPMPADLPQQTMRALLGVEDPKLVPILPNACSAR